MKYRDVAQRLASNMGELTMNHNTDLAVENTELNQSFLENGKSLKFLRDMPLGKGDHAIVIASGPSLYENKIIEQIKKNQYKGSIIATDSSISYCLRNGIIPDLVASVDPHRTRMVRWFGDSNLTKEKIS